MNMGMAPRPDNEELRAQTVVKTGLIDAPNPDLFRFTAIWQKTLPVLIRPLSACMTADEMLHAEAGEDFSPVRSPNDMSSMSVPTCFWTRNL